MTTTSDGGGKEQSGGASEQNGGGVSNMNGFSNAGGRFSYKEKLLSLGDSGFLEMNMSANEAMKGWKDYFSKMSGKMPMEEGDEIREDDVVEDEGVTSWMNKGKLPSLQLSAEEFTTWCKPYAFPHC